MDVATAVGAVGAGESADTVAEEYGLSRAQAHAALLYAAHVAGHVPPAVREGVLRFLLDENFPLRLLRELRFRGVECDHVIELGLRGVPDSEIVSRVASDPDH